MWKNPMLNILLKRIKSSVRICEPWSRTAISTEIVVSVFSVMMKTKALGHSWSSSNTKFIDTWKSPTLWFLYNDDKNSYKHVGISVDCQALTFPAVGLHSEQVWTCPRAGDFRILGVPVQWGSSWTSLNMYGGMVLYRLWGECWVLYWYLPVDRPTLLKT